MWIKPSTSRQLDHQELLRSVKPGDVIFLGETHDHPAHHRWQVSIISGLLALGYDLQLGFEAIPRTYQSVLDELTSQRLEEEEFFKAVNWDQIWGFDKSLYWPLFELARDHGLALVALNIERAIVSKVGKHGWEALSDKERAELGNRAPISERYESFLTSVLSDHLPEEQKPDKERIQRFIDAQSLWDVAMAGKLATYHDPAKVSIAIIGSGHLEFGDGVPSQFEHRVSTAIHTWLPFEIGKNCELPPAEFADAAYLFSTRPVEDKKPLRLGVQIEQVDGKLLVKEVKKASLAYESGLKSGDWLLTAGSTALTEVSVLKKIVQQQASGSWLPVVYEREKKQLVTFFKIP